MSQAHGDVVFTARRLHNADTPGEIINADRIPCRRSLHFAPKILTSPALLARQSGPLWHLITVYTAHQACNIYAPLVDASRGYRNHLYGYG